MIGQIDTSHLRRARELSGKSQVEIAQRLAVSSSVVSRLETAEQADGQIAERYLDAVDTDFAREITAFFKDDWAYSERPRFDHPQRAELWSAEGAFRKLKTFEDSEEFDDILQGPLNALRSRLLAETDFIKHTEHAIAFIGDIGAGKTTALSHVTKLMLGEGVSARSVFPTGSGRTTVCEVAIKIAPAYGIAVDAMDEEGIRRLVFDLVHGVSSGKGGLPSELERVIRNMADVRRTTVKGKAGEKATTRDGLRELLDELGDPDAAVTEIVARLELRQRTNSQMIFSSENEGSLEWLSSNISKINYGQHPGFSVPERITVLLPLDALLETPYLLSVIDTKGVEGTTQRADLMSRIEDERTITVLCSKFPDAPGATAMSIVREVEETGSDAARSGRLCLLVLPREGEAMGIVDDSGANPETPDEGYAIREDQIDQQFSTEGFASMPSCFFQAGVDDPQSVWNWLTARIEALRHAKVEQIRTLVASADDLVANVDAALVKEARRSIGDRLGAVSDRLSAIATPKRFPQQNLITEAKKTHQSSIAASVNRQGDWDNFPVAYILGQGVKIDANIRTQDAFVRMDEAVETLNGELAHIPEMGQFLRNLQEEIKEWRKSFLSRAAIAGTTLFAPHLQSAEGMWDECDERYGRGGGYRVDVSDIFRDHFEKDKDAIVTLGKVERQVSQLWQKLVIEQLQAFATFDEAVGT